MEDFEDRYNFIFNQLVSNKEDLVGSIGYVYYKLNKVEYIEKYKNDHSKVPDYATLREWQKGECTKAKIDNYKTLANQRITDFYNQLHAHKENELDTLKQELDNRERKIKDKENTLNKKEKVLSKKENDLLDKEQKLKNKESDLKNKNEELDKLEKDLKNRTKYCHVKSKWSFLSGIAQSFLASLLFMFLCFIVIITLRGQTDLIAWITNFLRGGQL
jgi:DNA repair exonuclease SbcCD ATPase subunit